MGTVDEYVKRALVDGDFTGCEQDITRVLQLYYPWIQVQFGGPWEANENPGNSEASAPAQLSALHVQIDGREQAGAHVYEVVLQIGGAVAKAARAVPMVVAPVSLRERRRPVKHALRRALYEALVVLTGHKQPWGALTGVRPGKLVHSAFRSGTREAGALRRYLQDEYGVEDSRAALLVEIAERERSALPDLYDLGRAVSVYVGIPFCPTHCAYCTFPAYSMVEKARYAEGFLTVLLKEIKRAGDLLRAYGITVTTVYVGGGTPTSLKAGELQVLLAALREHLPGASSWRELNVEAGRADTITPDRVKVMREAGVTRVSVNPQSFRAATLKAIGRGHSPEIVDKRFALFRDAGFTNINMDVILGLPGETLDDVRYTLERTLRLAPDAVTVHTLSLKRSSAVTRERDAYAVAPDTEVRAMMDLADREVRAAGQRPYYLYRQKDILANLENIGYALPGKEGLYNISIIEEAQTILALGGGAASKWVSPAKGVIGRHQNPREPSVYVGTQDAVWEQKERVLRPLFEEMAASAHTAPVI
ncbi:MAG: coproporphyrinogen dehydrogenase HemZ [Firmicutes bacterium]|nr:coproporphyrinogen dehydrogenase HemZ [Bacillota bacterium]